MTAIDPWLFGVFALSMILLSLKALFLGAATAGARGRRKQFLNEEDAKWLWGAHLPADGEGVARIGRAHRNDLENLLLFAVVGAIYVVAGGTALLGSIYCAAFVTARAGHTFAYLGKRPALRRYTYTLGFLAIIAIAIHAGVLVLGALPRNVAGA